MPSYSLWRFGALGGHRRTCSVVLDCFVVEDPCTLNVLSIFNPEKNSREDFQVWSAAESDVDGCMALSNPTVVQPTTKLSSDDVPVLCILDALTAAGYEGKKAAMVHDNSHKFFDCRGLSRRRWYLKAVLAFDDLLKRGTESFRSSGSETCFRLLLKSPSGVPPGLKAAHYKSQLKKLQNPEDCRCLDQLPPRIHSRPKIGAVKSIDVVDFAGGSSSDEDVAKPVVDEVAGEDPASSSVVRLWWTRWQAKILLQVRPRAPPAHHHPLLQMHPWQVAVTLKMMDPRWMRHGQLIWQAC